MDAHFGELFGQGNFLLIIKDQAGLLLTVPERHIMNFDMVEKCRLLRTSSAKFQLVNQFSLRHFSLM
ncbi:MAG: hypothetical protein ACLTYN_07795 [Dysosmobacter welbionis]